MALPHLPRRAPQVVVANHTHIALANTYRALQRAHPILGELAPAASGWSFATPELSDAEHFAALVLVAIEELVDRLDDYAASLESENDAAEHDRGT